MDGISELIDPSDWLHTSLPQLTSVESALRCQVCKDFFDTPMLTSCSHTFCSLCIRRCLTNDGICPTCRSPDQEIRLRRNWSVQEVVDAFQHARPTLIQLGSNQKYESKGSRNVNDKRKLEELDTSHVVGSERRSTRRKVKLQQALSDSEHSEADSISRVDDEQEPDVQPDDGLHACPICQQRMKEEEVFPHLDVHTQSDHESESQNFASRYSPHMGMVLDSKRSKFPERLPQLNYSLLKENALRKKLTDLGIPSGGPKALLTRRHTEWVNLVNANYDSSRPRAKRELLQELSVWDRSQGRLIPTGSGYATNANSVMRKDFDSTAWATAHTEDFQRLVKEARHRGLRKVDDAEPVPENTAGAATDDSDLHQVITRDPRQPSRSEERVTEVGMALGHDSSDFKAD